MGDKVESSTPRGQFFNSNYFHIQAYILSGLILTVLWTVLIIGLNLTVIIIISRYKKRSRLYFFLFHLALAGKYDFIFLCYTYYVRYFNVSVNWNVFKVFCLSLLATNLTFFFERLTTHPSEIFFISKITC